MSFLRAKSACMSAYLVCFCIFGSFEAKFADWVGARLKKDGVTPKHVKLFGKDFLQLVDHYFWHLPFASVKQAHAVREKAGTPQDEWEKRIAQMQAEHETEENWMNMLYM